MFSDSKRSLDQILDWNLKYASQRDGIQPIQLRFYDCADYCFGVIFPDVCYIAQYMLADAEAQVQTPRLPLVKYKSDSFTYKRLFWHFNRVWENSSLNYEELIQFIEKQPVVARRFQRLNTSKNSDR